MKPEAARFSSAYPNTVRKEGRKGCPGVFLNRCIFHGSRSMLGDPGGVVSRPDFCCIESAEQING
ncbi:MAG TPA: hypothetical protein VF607_13200, partial [Verrucomicrobiae bacterium]